jgi:hypothetical protein
MLRSVQRREPETSLCVLIARRMEPEHSGSSSQRPLGLRSRVAFCYPGSLLVSSKGRLSALGCRKSTCHVLTARRAQPRCRASFPPNRFPSPIALEGMTNRGLRRRRWTRSSKCAARSRGDLINILDGTAVISPAAAKSVSSSFLDRWPLSQ